MTPGSTQRAAAAVIGDNGTKTGAQQPASGVGAPIPRFDGFAKVTGAARYAGEEAPGGTLHGVLVPSTIAAGAVTSIEVAQALRVPGVVRVLTHDVLAKVAVAPVPPAAQSFTPMQDARVMYEGQPVAIVLAETLEAAEEAAAKVRVSYRRETPAMFSSAEIVTPKDAAAKNGYAFTELDTRKGSFDEVWPSAIARVDQTYSTALRHHNPMEPSATLAEWRGDDLHVWDATQWTFGIRYALAAMLGITPSRIHVRCPYTGGGFGCKGYVWPHQVLAVLAAKVAARPVKINLAREGMYTGSGYQPEVVNRVRLAADREGRLTGIHHHSTNISSRFDDYIEFASAGTRSLYATPVLATESRIRRCNVGTPTAMRAPHEGPGLFALESAMDELAVALRMDPLELRLRNHADRDPVDDRPFSSKKLEEVYREGARRFGWEKRAPQSRAKREGDLLIGWGMASCVMTTFRFASAARVTMAADGSVLISAGTQEIGTGPYTVMPQIASEVLGIPTHKVRLALGDTALPETGGTFGSSTTLSLGSAVKSACEKLKARLQALAPDAKDLSQALAASGINQVSADATWKPHGDAMFDAAGGKSGYSMHTWGAVFVEVAVDEALGLVRLRRAVGGYSAGKIVNPRTARSQMIGGIVWGYGQAVLEESAIDERYARYLSKNLSGVMLPVNADIPDIDVFFADEFDTHASSIGARGIGELGATGVAAAIANAVWHATGKRIRKLPIHLSDLLA
jgi:xanthine dehydrogenase YagR molybdenum-binding subunit